MLVERRSIISECIFLSVITEFNNIKTYKFLISIVPFFNNKKSTILNTIFDGKKSSLGYKRCE